MARSRLRDVLTTRTLLGDGDPAEILLANGRSLPDAAVGDWSVGTLELLRDDLDQF